MEMQNKKLSAGKPTEPTQKYLDVAEVREDCIILRDGSLRAVIAVSSTNFALKSEEEQNAIGAAYQGFLNSLDFPLQILIHSRILDINGYLDKLRSLESSQTNELLRIQMSEYIEYIAKLIEFANIMSKTFYVVVPYSTAPMKQTFIGKFGKFFNPAGTVAANREDFDRSKTKLDERIAHVSSELGGMGLRTMQLRTEELIELLYQSYNFDAASPLHAESLEEMEVQKK